MREGHWQEHDLQTIGDIVIQPVGLVGLVKTTNAHCSAVQQAAGQGILEPQHDQFRVIQIEEMPHAEGITGLAITAGHRKVMPALTLNIRQQCLVFRVFRHRITELSGHFI